jgi:hypothetical protein
MVELPKKIKQAKVFEDFKKKYLEVEKLPYYSLDALKNDLGHHDIIIFGSDQIWNLDITGDTAEYYGGLCNRKKCNVVYAGSFGHDKLTPKEQECLKFFANFDRVSVREDYAKEILEEKGIDAAHVCDPVFLLAREKWSQIARKPSGVKEDKYIVYYTLKDDVELSALAREMAHNQTLKLISIHPNANKMNVGKQLFGIGPQEFLWLIENAEYVCTNSFHASAFSLIFGKKLIHTQLEKGKGRVQSLLDTVSARKMADEKGVVCFDLSSLNDSRLIEYIDKSKKFLEKIDEKKEDN